MPFDKYFYIFARLDILLLSCYVILGFINTDIEFLLQL